MTTDQVRAKFLDFMKQKGHAIIPRANLVPQDDPTTLFTGSGMQPLLPYLLGADHPQGDKLADSQTCFRAEDIDEVGDNRHTTFFEMLGNWGLGSYFKEEQLPAYWDFLTKELKLDPRKLYITVFAGDEKLKIPQDTESVGIWKKLFKAAGIEANDIQIGSGANGYKKGMQGGRIFYYDAAKNWWSRSGIPANMPAGEPGGPDSEVFYDFGTPHDKKFGEHCHPNCDCGRFLEIGNSVFMQYRKNDDGSFSELPQKNVDFGGGLERTVAAVNNDPDIFKIDAFQNLIERIEKLSSQGTYQENPFPYRVIADHIRAAYAMIGDGVRPSNTEQGYVLRRFIRRAIRQGLRLGIERELCRHAGEMMAESTKRAFPEWAKQSDQIIEVLDREEDLFRKTLTRGVREFKKLVQGELTGEVAFKLFDTYGFPLELSTEEAQDHQVKLHPELQKDFDRLMGEQRQRSRTATAGAFKGGLADRSEQTTKLHTATHLMYEALKRVLGDHVVQRGSNITAERLRFDFSHPQKMTDEEKKKVEDLVNQAIKDDLSVSWKEYPTDEAFKMGASGAFGDKYGDTVKVYSVGKPGDKPYSLEICGGPHVEHTGVIGHFKIQKEESSSAGVRRIKATVE